MRTSRPLRGAAVTGTVLTTMVTGLIGGQTLAVSSAAETSPTPVESAMPGIPVPELEWTACGGDLECATAAMPRDYDRPNGPTIELALIRRPAIDTENKIGSLFVNAGGPGISGLEFFRTAPPGALDSFPRFDFVSWDPRGIGESSPAVDCTTDAQDDAALDYRFVRPQTLDRKALVAATQEAVDGCVDRNPGILSHLSTANTARDLDVLRAAVGDEKLTYVGISHGTHIGAAYSSLFPDRVRAMVADSPIDLDVWHRDPTAMWREMMDSQEASLDRFFAACAASQPACGFGGSNPEAAFDALVARLNQNPAPAPNSVHQTPVSGDDVLNVAVEEVVSRSRWSTLATALAQADAGDASLMSDLYDAIAGRRPDGSWTQSGVFFTTTAQDWQTSKKIEQYLDEGARAYQRSPHFWFLAQGYERLAYALYPVRPQDNYRGPFSHPSDAVPALVIGVTHDGRTPYAWAERYAADLGNTRLLTYDGDRHGALTDLNPCVFFAAFQYVNDLTLPAEGTTCTQDYEPFPGTEESARSQSRSGEQLLPEQWLLPTAGLGTPR